MQDGISSISEFSSNVCGSIVYSCRGFRKCHIGPNYCLREEVDLKIADNIYFFILYPLEKRLLYSWKLGILKKLLSLRRKTAVLRKIATWAVLNLKKNYHSL